MFPEAKSIIINNFRSLFTQHGDSPEGIGSSPEGQILRFRKFIEIGDLKGKRILDLGCGLGHFYSFLKDTVGEVDYTGVDIVPETIAFAKEQYPKAKFICHDILVEDLTERFDYVFICAVFNTLIPEPKSFMKELLTTAFRHCEQGLAFNFVSTHVNYPDKNVVKHDSSEVLDFCIDNLSRKVILHHHYMRCDVALFVSREE